MYQSIKTWIKAHPVTSILIVLAIACLALLNTCAKAADLITLKSTEPSVILYATDTATAASANATTSYVDVPGVTFSVPATNKQYGYQFIRVCYWGDVTKATATTGTVGVFANGAVITASEMTVASAAGAKAVISQCYTVARSSAAAQTVKLQYKSGDTNAFTINNMMVELSILYTIQ